MDMVSEVIKCLLSDTYEAVAKRTRRNCETLHIYIAYTICIIPLYKGNTLST